MKHCKSWIPRVEQLEERRLMTVESGTWNDAASLRLSFVPDGTSISTKVSQLSAVMESSPAGAAWRESIAKAFQIWAQYAEINVGVVSDSGAAIGSQGPTHGDERFGDIRVGAIPMAQDTWAASVHEDMLSAGSWAGDLIFNSAANWNLHQDDLLRVAVHEAGHILGLPHSDDPNSPMHTHGIPTSITPTAEEIAALQAHYGVRGPDANETTKANDSIAEATRVRFSDASSHDGTKPLFHFGAISSPTDRDYFFYDPQFAGRTTFRVVSAGLSQLQYRMSVTDKDGQVLGTATSHAELGGDVSVALANVAKGQKLYVRIEADGAPLAAIGSYALIIQLNDLSSVSDSQALAAAQLAHRWFASSASSLTQFDVSSLFRSTGSPTLNDDAGTDDNPADARRVSPYVDSATRRASKAIGTISADTDRDGFRFRSPHFNPGTTLGMLVEINSLERDALLPKVVVLNALLNEIPFETHVHGNGVVRVWLPSVQSNVDYTVQIRADAPEHARGNYEIHASFQSAATTAPVMVSTQLDDSNLERQFVWYVARPQLFSLALEATTGAANDVAVWCTVYDHLSRPVHTLATTAGQLRTGSAVLLEPGTYYLQFGGRAAGLASLPSIQVKLLGDAEINPIGPPPTAVGTTPMFVCPTDTSLFCYPNNPPTSDPFVINSDPVTILPTAKSSPIDVPTDEWFWNPPFLRTNPILPWDSSGDGHVSAIDALLVINGVNQLGAGRMPAPPVRLAMLDVNADGFLSALDALLVINRLNARGTSEGEGEGLTLSAHDQALSDPSLWVPFLEEYQFFIDLESLEPWKRERHERVLSQ